MPVKNDLFRAARERLPAPSGAPRPMSRRELAEAVNAYLWHEHRVRENLDQDDIGKIENGKVRWPGRWRRLGCRAVLGATTDTEIGLYFHRITAAEPDRNRQEVIAPASQEARHLPRSADRSYSGWRDFADTVGIGAHHDVRRCDMEADSMRRREVLNGLSAVAVAPIMSLEILRHGLSRTVDAGQLDWQHIAADYARDFYTTPAAALLDQLSVDLAVLHDLMAPKPDADLSRVAGQLSVIVAMTMASTGQLTLARRWWRTARAHADASGDLDTRVWVRDWEVVNGTYESRPLPQILELADETIALMGDRVCCGAAGVLSGRAQALALAGRRDEAVAALEAVAEVTERMPATVMADSESMFGWPEVRLHHTASYVYTHVGAVEAAMAAQDRALRLYPDDLERERAQLQMHRASCLIQDGHIADGLRYAADVLDRLPLDRHNALLYEVARHVVAAVPRQERHRTEVAELRDRITTAPSR